MLCMYMSKSLNEISSLYNTIVSLLNIHMDYFSNVFMTLKRQRFGEIKGVMNWLF